MQHGDNVDVMQLGILTALRLLIVQTFAVNLLLVGTDAAVNDGP
jgi:hypothetical protein